MSKTNTNSKRLVKNIMLLYIRMLFTMVVTLYTSRIVLDTLGVDNYGIYNVVGGFVAMFSVISGSLTSAISRFITYELGHGNKEKLKRIFSTSVSIQIIIAITIFIIAESIGIWFLNYKMNIPSERLYAANWVLHCSIITFMINLISVPYNASIIAHERMSAFAYISILEVSLKLIIVYMLLISPVDKLITYAILLMIIALLIRFVYVYYCKYKFEECTYHYIWDKAIFKEMIGFAGWNFLGNTAYILNTQGVNMLINIFFGVAMNTARGIAVQVDGAIMGFINNFSIAIQPQITKSYATGDFHYMFKLINRGTKFSAYIMFFFMIPFIIEAETVLGLWLKKIPEYSINFVQVVLFASFCGAIGNYLYYGIMATGNIKHYQILVTLMGAFVFPLSWLAYSIGMPAITTYVIYGIIYALLNIIRVNSLHKQIGYPRMSFITEAVLPIVLVGALSTLPSLIVTHFIEPSNQRLVLSVIISILSTLIVTYSIGLTKYEKDIVIKKILQFKNKLKKNANQIKN